MVVALLLAVPGLHSVAARLTDAEPAWVIAGTILELLSCLSYVILFQGVFWRGPRALTARIAWSELGANSLVSMGGAGGIALGAWVLRLKGAPAERIAERSVALFALTSVVNAVALVVCGVGMGVGILDGPHDALLTFLPAGVGATAIVATLILARGARHLGPQSTPCATSHGAGAGGP